MKRTTDALIYDTETASWKTRHQLEAARLQRLQADRERDRQQFAAQRRPTPPPEMDVIEWPQQHDDWGSGR